MLDRPDVHRREVPVALERQLRTQLARMARAAAKTDGRPDYEVSLQLVDDAAIRVLNRDYRGKNKPTDVLAFAQREGPAASPDLLGDIVISVPTAKRQAQAAVSTPSSCTSRRTGSATCSATTTATDAEERDMNARAANLRAEAGRRGPTRAA